MSLALGETLSQGPCMARCTTGPRPRRKLSNPPPSTSLTAPFLCLHERLAVRETHHQWAMVVINAAEAMHGILIFLHLPLVSALHNKTFSPFMAKRWGCISWLILTSQWLPLSPCCNHFCLVLFSCAIVDICLFSLLSFTYFF